MFLERFGWFYFFVMKGFFFLEFFVLEIIRFYEFVCSLVGLFFVLFCFIECGVLVSVDSGLGRGVEVERFLFMDFGRIMFVLVGVGVGGR